MPAKAFPTLTETIFFHLGPDIVPRMSYHPVDASWIYEHDRRVIFTCMGKFKIYRKIKFWIYISELRIGKKLDLLLVDSMFRDDYFFLSGKNKME